MRRFFAMMRYSKKLLIAMICLCVDVLLAVGLCVFDLVQIIQISKNSVSISPAFVTVNLILISLMVLNLVVIASAIIIKKIKEKRDGIKKS